MNTEIRTFEKGDKQRVEDFFAQMSGEARFFFNANGYNQKNAMRFFGEKGDPNTIRWLALSEGRMVGYVFLWDLDKKIVSLGVAVSEDFKGKKLGEKLINTAKDWCKENEKGGIILTTHPANTRAQMLYYKCGFRFMGTSNNYGEFLYLYNFSDNK